jgi:hypothetical protein
LHLFGEREAIVGSFVTAEAITMAQVEFTSISFELMLPRAGVQSQSEPFEGVRVKYTESQQKSAGCFNRERERKREDAREKG